MKITDRKYKTWNERCQHEINWKTGKECNKKLGEDTGQCPLGHGRLLHMCKTECCSNLISGNHNFCDGHRKKKVKTICKTQQKIMREFRSRMWGAKSRQYNMDDYETKKEFEEWKEKQLEKTYDHPKQNEELMVIP